MNRRSVLARRDNRGSSVPTLNQWLFPLPPWEGGLYPNQFHQLALDGGQYRPKLVPAFQYCAALADQRPHALLRPQIGSLFDAVFGTFGGASEGAEHRGIAAQINCIIAPFSGGYHPAVQVQYLGKFVPVKTDLTQPVECRKRSDDRAQTFLLPLVDLPRAGTGGATSRSAINTPSLLRSVSISHCRISRLCVAGSNSSRQGVP